MNDHNNSGNQPPNQGNASFGQRANFSSDPNQQPPVQPQQVHQTAERYAAKSPQEVLQPKEVPVLKKRSKQAQGGMVVFLNFCLSCLMLGMLLIGVGFYFGKVQFEQAGPLTSAKKVVIEKGSSLGGIAAKLEAAGIVSSSFIFRTSVRAAGEAGNMKPGEYAFKPNMSMRDVMNTLLEGKGIIYKVSVPEGLTSFQIVNRVAANTDLVGDMPAIIPAEGSLMPDTYPFEKGTTRAEILELMRRSQEQFLAEVWERRVEGLPIQTPQEMVTLASIVEKETGKADERPRVASVFINRLNKGMRLQSDPTIIYGIFGGQGKPKDRPIYRSDIKNPTPYNTYTINGLPPTPIANPGRAALEAVANPSRTDDIYFVASGDGGHVFAKTLAEHNANVKRWRAIESRIKKEAEANAQSN